MMSALPTSALGEPQPLLVRAVSCKLADAEIASLMRNASATDPGMRSAVRHFALPTGNLYKLDSPMRALGYTASQIYVQPARILMAIPGVTPKAVTAKLALSPPTAFGPAERRVANTRTLVAYRLHQPGLADLTLIGCQYDHPVAADWIGGD